MNQKNGPKLSMSECVAAIKPRTKNASQVTCISSLSKPENMEQINQALAEYSRRRKKLKSEIY